MTARIIGIDLSLLHTGIAVSTIDGNIIYSDSFSVESPKTTDLASREMQQIARTAQWIEQAKASLLYAFYYARRDSRDIPIYLVYESRPFLLAKHRGGRQSSQAVLSYAESLCMLRLAITQVTATPCAKPEPNVGAVSANWWQKSLMSSSDVSHDLLEEARAKHLKGVPKGQLEQKAFVMAALYSLTNSWPKSDHEADVLALSIMVASVLQQSLDGWSNIIDPKHNW